MHEMIRPTGRPLVWVMLIAIGSTLFFTSLYLSDRRGSIEPEPHGFFDYLTLVTSRLAMMMIAIVVMRDVLRGGAALRVRAPDALGK